MSRTVADLLVGVLERLEPAFHRTPRSAHARTGLATSVVHRRWTKPAKQTVLSLALNLRADVSADRVD